MHIEGEVEIFTILSLPSADFAKRDDKDSPLIGSLPEFDDFVFEMCCFLRHRVLRRMWEAYENRASAIGTRSSRGSLRAA
mmetsp:Transcript_38489/g.38862  ORF Transcript_38489/g.38862 Transcript_38489/m.38862 type:complete len:80 (-) Transcript_38489:168-407(-)